MASTEQSLPCRDVVELVTDYLEHALGDVDRRRLEAHLEACDGCTTYVEQVRATVDAVGRLPRAELSPGLRERLRLAFRDLTSPPA
jgi:anti-sigma factor RsiW